MGKSLTKEEFILKAKEIHGDKYDYSRVSYINNRTKITIGCPIHGYFEQTPKDHLKGRGCNLCGVESSRNSKFKDNDYFLSKSKEVHGDRYDYTKSVYISNIKKLTITCKEHGDFEMTPAHHYTGQGCPKCRYISSASSKRRPIEEVITLFNNKHNNEYDYSLITTYKNDRIKLPILCKTHGLFYQTTINHLSGQGCPKCGQIKCGNSQRHTVNDFINKSSNVHGEKYDYSKVEYVNNAEKVLIICPVHGEFWQKPGNHISLKQGCKKCFFDKSNIEKEIFEFIKSITKHIVVENDRTVIKPKELDIFIPKLNIAFEVNGLIWHSEKFEPNKNAHLIKTQLCEEQGIRLIHIFEDEWIYKKDIVKSRIENIIGVTKKKLFARNCIIKIIDGKTSNNFLNENHIQGACNNGSTKLGLYYDNELVSLMTFGKSRHFVGSGKHEYELLRFCNKLDTIVVGGASKLFAYFLKTQNPKEVISYADRRWSDGNLYQKLNFKLYNKSAPNYFYVIDKKRVYRFNLRKNVLIKKYGCSPTMTEKEFCFNKQWYRIYDCGCLCYIWKNEKNI